MTPDKYDFKSAVKALLIAIKDGTQFANNSITIEKRKRRRK